MRRLTTVALATACAGLFASAHLGARPLEDWDEGLHAKIALDMLRSGDWLVYRIDGYVDPTITKPPLMFYAILAAMRALGPTETAVRLGAALSFCALGAAVASFAYRHLNPRIALWAVVILCAKRHIVFDHFARHGGMDAPLALGLALTMFLAWRHGSRSTGWRAGAAYAFALLVKGLAALQVVPVLCIWAAYRRDRALVKRVGATTALAAVPTMVWMLCREHAAPGYLAAMLRVDLAKRVADVVGAAPYDPWYYVRLMLHDFGPFGAAAAVVLVMRHVRGPATGEQGPEIRDAARARELALFLGCWTALPIAMFSLARTQHLWYVLPSYVPCALLAAWVTDRALRRITGALTTARSRRVTYAVLATVVAAALVQRNVARLMRVADTGPSARRAIASIVERAASCPHRAEVFRAYHVPALLFYLTRAGLDYAWADAVGDRPREERGGGCRSVLAAARDADEARHRLGRGWHATHEGGYVLFQAGDGG